MFIFSHATLPLMYQDYVDMAISAARVAGDIALSFEGRDVNLRLKGGDRHNPLTAADEAVDAYLQETLLAMTPQFGWLSEETADNFSRLEREYCWVVDPIDGTQAYVRWLMDGMPRDVEGQNRRQFVVSIALLHQGRPVVGVVYAPLRAQMISAVIGEGVWVNGQPCQRAEHPDVLTEALYLSSVSETTAGLLDFLQGQVMMQPFGSVAYKMALVGVDAKLVTGSVKPKNTWDVAAGALIATEAGLLVTDLAGDPYNFTQESTKHHGVIVAPPLLYPQLKKLLPSQPFAGY